MKKLMMVCAALALTACATHTPAKMPKGKPFPINEKQLQHYERIKDNSVELFKESA